MTLFVKRGADWLFKWMPTLVVGAIIIAVMYMFIFGTSRSNGLINLLD